MLRYAITDRVLTLCAGQDEYESLVKASIEVAQRGVDFLLIREKDLPARELLRLSREVIAAVRKVSPSTCVLIAGRPDVAVAVGADGVHLSARAGELTIPQVRHLFSRVGLADPFVSVSCHTLDEVRRMQEAGASAVLFAPVFGKAVDGRLVSEGVGVNQLRQACAEAGSMPVFALGGVTRENAGECMAAGAAGVAGIRLFFALESAANV